MSSRNRVEIIGFLGNDAEVRHTNSGVAVANMRVASNERFRDRATGELRERTEWVRCAMFSVPEGLIPHLRKGRQVLIEGKLETRSYEASDGSGTRYSTQVVVRPGRGELILLGRPKEKVPEEVQVPELEKD
jgi:single-strand DNA-binding protein